MSLSLPDELLEGVSRGEYQLLLGAGASMDSRDATGTNLLSAPGLCKAFTDDFQLPLEPGQQIGLQRAYEHIEHRRSTSGLTRADYLSQRFSGCKPADWYASLAGVPWKRIWTLNIDDVVEVALEQYFRDAGPDSPVRQSPVPFSWESIQDEPRPDKDEVQVIHLHGFARWLGSGTSRLVFSILEYLSAARTGHSWHYLFGAEYLQRPFIVVGARLVEEYDLADILRRGSQARVITGKPSAIVLKSFSKLDREDFTRWGLVCIEADAEYFSRDLQKQIKPHLDVQIKIGATEKDTKRVRMFYRQYGGLDLDQTAAPKRHDFYNGDEPDWSDIVTDLDAPLERTTRILGRIGDDRRSTPLGSFQKVYCLVGEPGEAKSACMLRIGRELIVDGYDVYLYQGLDKLDIDTTVWWVQRRPKTALLVDNAADHADTIGRLCERAKALSRDVLIVGAERTRRLNRVLEGVAADILCAPEVTNVPS